jgi:hypothetical protein
MIGPCRCEYKFRSHKTWVTTRNISRKAFEKNIKDSRCR